MSIQSAINCFNENYTRFNTRPVTDHEKYNLYAGLSELAEAIKRLEYQISLIKGTVDAIDQKIH